MKRSILIPTALAVTVVGLAACGGEEESHPTTIVEQEAPVETTPPTVEVTPPTTQATPAPTIEEAPTTTTEPIEFVKAREFFTLVAENTQESLLKATAMTEPTTGAYQYVAGLGATRPYETNAWETEPDTMTERDGRFTLARDSFTDVTNSERTFSDVVWSQNGLIADFSRNGVPVSQTVVGSGQVIPFAGGSMTIVDYRFFEGSVVIAYTMTNDGTVSEDDWWSSVPSYDTYVAEGRQWDTYLGESDPQPGVTVAGYMSIEDAPRGGLVSGYNAPDIQLP